MKDYEEKHEGLLFYTVIQF